MSQKERKEKELKLQDIIDTLESGIRLDKDKKKHLKAQAQKLKEELSLVEEKPASEAPQPSSQANVKDIQKRIDDINDILSAVQNMEKGKRIELVKEVTRLTAQIKELQSGPAPAVPGAQTAQAAEQEGGQPQEKREEPKKEEYVLSQKELREKENKIEDLEQILLGGAKLEKEKKAKFQKELRKLQEEVRLAKEAMQRQKEADKEPGVQAQAAE